MHKLTCALLLATACVPTPTEEPLPEDFQRKLELDVALFICGQDRFSPFLLELDPDHAERLIEDFRVKTEARYRALAAGGVEVDRRRLGECEELASECRSCSVGFRGTKQEGEACFDDAQCDGTLCGRTDEGVCRVCTQGFLDFRNDCTCPNGTCLEDDVGSRTCFAFPTREGDVCDPGGDYFGAPLECPEPWMLCLGQCIGRRLGDACGEGDSCAPGFLCTDGVCGEGAVLGEACGAGCGPDLLCDAGTCIDASAGTPCHNGEECFYNRVCLYYPEVADERCVDDLYPLGFADIDDTCSGATPCGSLERGLGCEGDPGAEVCVEAQIVELDEACDRAGGRAGERACRGELSTTTCSGDESGVGTCVNRPGPGDACDALNPCVDGAARCDGTCVSLPSLDEPCTDDETCALGLVCSATLVGGEGTCQRRFTVPQCQ